MKLVSATKLRKAQGEILQMRPYARKIKSILGSLGENVSSDVLTPYIESRNVDHVTFIVITSDRGLCGSFNANVIKMTISILNEKYSGLLEAGKVRFVCFGKKGYDFFSKSKYNKGNDSVVLIQKYNSENVFESGQNIIDSFLNRNTDQVIIVYNQFKNAATQILSAETMLPVDVRELQGKDSSSKKDGMLKDYIFEPDMEGILTTLIQIGRAHV